MAEQGGAPSTSTIQGQLFPRKTSARPQPNASPSSARPTNPPPAAIPPPSLAQALAFLQAGQAAEATPLLAELVSHNPQHPDLLHFLGIAWGMQQQHERAVDYFATAVSYAPDRYDIWQNLGGGLWLLHRYPEAAQAFQRCQLLNPQLPLVQGYAFNSRLRYFAWGDPASDYAAWQAERAALEAAVLRHEAADTPFPFLAVSSDAAVQLACAQRASHAYLGLMPSAEARPDTRPANNSAPRRLRLAYLSGDFRTHPVSMLLAGVWEAHDPAQVELIAISLNPPDHSPLGQRVRAAFHEFHDLGHLGDAELAQQLQAMCLDMVIDLMGHTQGSRPGVLARRVAPIQINYLGFPGSSGMLWIDYLIADPFVIPPTLQAGYSEKILYLPECFQANDASRSLPNTTPNRMALGLPEDACVLCCFNNSFKLNPPIFVIWLELLHAFPHTVLWLYVGDETAKTELRHHCQAAGVDPARLIFAAHVPYAEHLARLPAADLFLDTLPFNGGTTVSDALWVGLPVLTCTGEAFASRMAGSLLMALGLPELVTDDLASYRQRAFSLLSRPTTLRALRHHLHLARRIQPVFATTRFCRHLEQGLQQIWQRHIDGLPPEHTWVQALPVTPNADLAVLEAENQQVVQQLQAGNLPAAANGFLRLLEQHPDQPSLWCNLAVAQGGLGYKAEMLHSYEYAFRRWPELKFLRGLVLNTKLQLAAWQTYQVERNELLVCVAEGREADIPLNFIAVSDKAELQQRCAEIFARRYTLPGDVAPYAHPVPSQNLRPHAPATCHHARPLRVGYLSPDFKDHAVSHLLVGVWEAHDPCQVESIAIALNPPDNSATGQRVRAAFSAFYDWGQYDDAELAARIYALQLDILLDLAGHTKGARPGVLARRPAPLQINYLGFPATSGMPWVDYLIADPFLIPEATQASYSEKILYLPECFQANDTQRYQSLNPPTRASLGLPEHGFVFCSFNQTYKLNPEIFSTWLAILAAVPHSVLWLYVPEALAQENLRAEASSVGVAPSRLIFAPAMAYAEHLARLSVADLALDTLPFNGGTTSSDALWAGTPVLTCCGEAFAARMAGSLLMALGLPELVTDSLAAYQAQAIQLAQQPQQLHALRQRLHQAKTASPVFNSARFCRHLEAGLWQIHAQRCQGLPPAHCYVGAMAS